MFEGDSRVVFLVTIWSLVLGHSGCVWTYMYSKDATTYQYKCRP